MSPTEHRGVMRSRDALRASTTTVLAPVVRRLGFANHGSRAFVRVVGDVLQHMDLQLSAYGSKDFAVNYTALPLYPPTDHIYLPCGGRVPRGRSGDGWWPAKTHDAADASMVEVVARLEEVVFPFFERTANVAGLRDELLATSSPHNVLAAACCEARLGLADALRTTASAIASFQRSYGEMPARKWCIERISVAEELATALGSGTEQDLLDDWRLKTIGALRLEARGRPTRG